MAERISALDPDWARARKESENAFELGANRGLSQFQTTGKFNPSGDPFIDARVNNLIAQKTAQNLPTTLASMADPYKTQRDQLINDPSAAISQSPFFKFMQERAMNATQGQNRAGGFANSGRGLMALQDTAQKSSANFYFPYLAALGKPGQGADAFWQAYQYLNPRTGGGGGGSTSRLREPRQSLAGMSAATVPGAAAALPSGGGNIWENPYGPGMGPGPMGTVVPLSGYGPSAGAGTGYLRNNDSGASYFFNPEEGY